MQAFGAGVTLAWGGAVSFVLLKSVEIRYRWRVDGTGQVQALSDRAQNLCS